ncbi:hypothetical protein C0993_012379 [Termitomyces sp. T159_Od127]|nr:hypothetical protein C0993_012379 [Termitomyces sp. T159_Od127]
MQTHIAKSLQTHCQAIHRAVAVYNKAALALNPPKPTLDWSKVSHYTFLEDFALIRDTNHDITDKPWAKLVIRELIKKDQKVKCAHEEIIRCNVEVQRLHTSILDKERHFTICLQAIKDASLPIYGAVNEFVTRRCRINTALLTRISQIYLLPGFTGVHDLVSRKDQCHSDFQHDPVPEVEDDDDDEVEALNGIMNFLGDLPFLTHGKHHPVFPLPVKCLSSDNAKRINCLQAFVQRLIEEKLDLKSMQNRIRHSLFISQFVGPYWAVFLGQIPGIYSEWEGPNNAAMQLEVSKSHFASCSEFLTFRGALIFKVSKGMNFRGDQAPDYYTVKYDPQSQPPSTPGRPAPSTPSRTSSSVKQAIPQSSGPSQPSASRYASPMKSQASSPTKPKVPTPNITGLQAHLSSPVLPSIKYSISFGEAIDSYIRSHGYNQVVVMILEQALVSSQGKRGVFIRDVCLEDMLRMEAKWIWDHIVKPSPLLPHNLSSCVMAILTTAIKAPKRYQNLTQHIIADASCHRPHRLKKKRKSQKKTAAAKAEAKAKCDARQEEYLSALQAAVKLIEAEAIKLREQFGGHTLDYYKAEILQTGHLKSKAQAVSRWNVFLHHEAKKANENLEGEEQQKVHQLSMTLREKWNSMSEEEKIALMDPLMDKLKEHRANLTYGQHNVGLETFNRMVNKQSSTTAELKTQLKNLINSSLGKQLKKILA